MDCREFEDIVNDFVRAKLIDAASRAAGMAHTEICGRCASRLADERALRVGLKSLAVSDEGKVAPAGVEATLLAAFRAKTSNPPARRLPGRSKRWQRWVLAAAAATLIASGFVLYRAVRKDPRKDDRAFTKETRTPQSVVKGEELVVKPEPQLESHATRPRHGSRRRLNKHFIIDNMTTYAEDSEYSTDFFPLGYGGDQDPMERGEVIRVQMPRSALIAFGLPVNVERADTPVKADLLVGEDGMARAIRFVR
ncbi:MAG: hypothetical protein J2P21_19750 [Chloracidobacterium sp.]|nr:hypothetical protein [Chloracidobacterium sp.]